jgi:hypothetical protein
MGKFNKAGKENSGCRENREKVSSKTGAARREKLICTNYYNDDKISAT